MKENQDKHEIDRIAYELGCEAEFYDGTASMYIRPFYVECKKQGWKDALLAKLRAIVCPTYSNYLATLRINDRYLCELDEKDAEIQSLKSQISTARKEAYQEVLDSAKIIYLSHEQLTDTEGTRKCKDELTLSSPEHYEKVYIISEQFIKQKGDL